MAHVITEPCIGRKNTGCVSVCPVDCIHPKPDEVEFETESQLFIDPATCIDCGLCVDACPVHAIFHEAAVPASWERYIEINANFYRR